ncbi:BRO family protein [Cytobacillus oceanisediminis]|uniref:BRO family protein n=1 Tax=Cytobacillus oceanisediminis TaxID=665099 RepID=UPI0020796CEC|nr:BRO family protein [Cytobacillus oceanisediminis]USK43757.1 ORF6C domain-containing protein [Cytobacillus oceanisediminis]
MNELQHVFEFKGQDLRTIIQNDEPWFVAKDVCDILELNNSRQALTRLDDEEKADVTINDGRQNRNYSIINESGLYELIFASRKLEAKMFKKWVKQEVLPSIRKTGSYTKNNNAPLSKDQALVTVLRTTADLVEDTQSLKAAQREIRKLVHEIENKVEEQITLTSGEQRRLQKGIAKKVYDLENGDRDAQRKLFRELHREIKDRFGVSSYKDVKRKELQSALRYIENWIPRKVS